MVVIDMSKVGQLIGEGTYPVVLTKASEKKTAKQHDMVTLQMTIKDSGTEWEGRPLFRNFVISSDPDADNSGVLFFLQQGLLAFGADEDDVTSTKFNPVDVAKKNYGNRALATVTHRLDPNDASKKFLDVRVNPSDL